MKVLPVAYHEEEVFVLDESGEKIPLKDDKGKVIKDEFETEIVRKKDAEGRDIVAIERQFYVCVVDRKVKHIDRACKVHVLECKDGDLDWSAGLVTVKEAEYDEEGVFLQSHNLSHEIQRRPVQNQANWGTGKVAWRGGRGSLASAANAILPRFNVATAPPKIISYWQAQANSPDADWVDGRKPTAEEFEEYQKAYAERRKQQQARAMRGRPVDFTEDISEEEGGPEGIVEGVGFEAFNV
jgi:hypothetical protein